MTAVNSVEESLEDVPSDQWSDIVTKALGQGGVAFYAAPDQEVRYLHQTCLTLTLRQALSGRCQSQWVARTFAVHLSKTSACSDPAPGKPKGALALALTAVCPQSAASPPPF